MTLGNPVISYYTLIILDDQGNTHTNETLPAPATTTYTPPALLLPLTNYTVKLTAISQLSPVPVTSPTVSLNISTPATGKGELYTVRVLMEKRVCFSPCSTTGGL